MATLKETVKALLTDNEDWTDLVVGTYDSDSAEMGRVGLTPETAPYSSGKLQLCAYLAWGVDTRTEIVQRSQRRFFQLFVYDHKGHAQVEAALALAKTILHRTRAQCDDGTIMVNWVDNSHEFRADELQGAAAMFGQFDVVYTRT